MSLLPMWDSLSLETQSLVLAEIESLKLSENRRRKFKYPLLTYRQLRLHSMKFLRSRPKSALTLAAEDLGGWCAGKEIHDRLARDSVEDLQRRGLW